MSALFRSIFMFMSREKYALAKPNNDEIINNLVILFNRKIHTYLRTL